MPLPKIKREDLKPGEFLCDYCTAKCCRYFALPIETPESWKEFDVPALVHDSRHRFRSSSRTTSGT